jgi:hypothetical protein
MITWTGLDGLHLDVEEAMSLAGILQLVDHLKTDFGPGFLVTLAPVSPASGEQHNLSSLSYKAFKRAFVV